MRYQVERRTAYGRTVFAVLEGEQVLARCDSATVAQGLVRLLEQAMRLSLPVRSVTP